MLGIIGSITFVFAACSNPRSVSKPSSAVTVDTIDTNNIVPGSECPKSALAPGTNAATRAAAAARSYVATHVSGQPGYHTTGFRILSDAPALPLIAKSTPDYLKRFRVSMLAYSFCGTAIGRRTYVVRVVFPAMLSAGDGTIVSHLNLFESRMPRGWAVWYNY
jgi:hypothetical protein